MCRFHWQFLAVKTESVSSPCLQKALFSSQEHLRMLCCSSKRSEITPVHFLGHCSGRLPLLPLLTLLILNCAIAVGCLCFFSFPLFYTRNSGIYHLQQTPSSSLSMQKAFSVMAVFSHVWEECYRGELSVYNTGFSTSCPISMCFVLGWFFLVILGTYLGLFQMRYLDCAYPTWTYISFHLVLLIVGV